MINNTEKLGSENIKKLIWDLSVPAITGLLVIALYNIVDAVFVGRGVGVNGLTALTIVFPVHMIIMALSQMFGIGGQSSLSIALGGGKNKRAGYILYVVSILSILAGLIFAILLKYFSNPLLGMFGADSLILPYASDYIEVSLYGIPFLIFFIGLNNLARGEGNARISMNTMIIAALTNAFLDYVFIFQFSFGIKGAAYASVISQIICSIYILTYFIGKKTVVKYSICRIKTFYLLSYKISSIGLASFFKQIGGSIVIILANRILPVYGTSNSVAIFGILNRLLMFISMPVFGFLQGINPIIGFNYGAKNFRRVKSAIKNGIYYSTIVVTVCFVCLMIFPEYILGIFTDEKELIAEGLLPLKIFFSLLPLLGFQIISAGIFQAMGNAKASMFLTMARQVVLLIPLIILLPLIYGEKGVYIAFPASEIITFLISSSMLYFLNKSLNCLNNKMEGNCFL
ncbi:MAG: MATE family efflux transporter [Candidatus Muiribacteriota bacterium]